MATGKEGGISQKADQSMSPYVVQLFKAFLCAYGPTFTTQASPHACTRKFTRHSHAGCFTAAGSLSAQKLVQLVNNAKENEYNHQTENPEMAITRYLPMALSPSLTQT
tara:strand:- start:100 stop:423 length:324 start_codon:yes stop_codon:yes gene_type:complete